MKNRPLTFRTLLLRNEETIRTQAGISGIELPEIHPDEEISERQRRLIESVRANIGSLREEKRSRLERLLEKREQIQSMASVRWQQGDHHERMLQILKEREEHPDITLALPENDLWQSEFCMLGGFDDYSAKNIWNALPDSRFKRFQELFCHEEDFIVPQVYFTNKRIRFAADARTLDVSACLASADRIPDKLAESLKLVTFEESDIGHPQRRLEKKSDQRVILGLKKIWDSAAYLVEGNERLLVISRPSPDVAKLYLDIDDPDPSIYGTVLSTRERVGGRGRFRARSVQHFHSLYAAARKTLHERRVYDKEIVGIETVMLEGRALRTHVAQHWKKETDQETKKILMGRAADILLRGSSMLMNVLDPGKKEAEELMRLAAGLKDKRDCVNPSAALARMTGAMNRLSRRLRDIQPKGGYNERDRLLLVQQLTLNVGKLQQVSAWTNKVASPLSQLELFGDRSLSSNQLQSQITGFFANHGYAIQSESDIPFRPLNVYAKAILHEQDALIEAMNRRNRKEAQTALVSMCLIRKFHGIRHCFETIKNEMAEHASPNAVIIAEWIGIMNQYFKTYQVLPDHRVPLWEEPFQTMRKALANMEQHLLKHGKAQTGPELRVMLLELKLYMETFDIEAIVEEAMRRSHEQRGDRSPDEKTLSISE